MGLWYPATWSYLPVVHIERLRYGNQVRVEKRDHLAAKTSRAHYTEAEPIKKNENGANTSKGVVVYEAGA